MFTQTYLVEIKNENGQIIDFFRHNEKRLQTILAKEYKFWKQQKENNSSLFREHIQDTNNIIVYASPYECNIDDIVYNKTMKEFLRGGIKQ